jgi:hypothetical protein
MSFTRTLDLSGTLYNLRPRRLQLTTPSGIWSIGLLFNIRAAPNLTRSDDAPGQWIFSVIRVDNVTILRSRAVAISPDLLRLHRPANPDLPPGLLSCTGPYDPGRRDLGDGTCKMIYFEE